MKKNKIIEYEGRRKTGVGNRRLKRVRQNKKNTKGNNEGKKK